MVAKLGTKTTVAPLLQMSFAGAVSRLLLTFLKGLHIYVQALFIVSCFVSSA
jgi:hypothetical protein